MDKKSVLFVCLGNICRSPMAEGIFRKIIEKNNESNNYYLDSAGMQGYHQGELPDSRMRHFASKRGYELTHRSRQFCRADFDKFDLIIGMDDNNINALNSKANTQEEVNKIFRMTDFCTQRSDDHVPDPYYGGDKGFDNIIDLLEDACNGLYSHLNKKFDII